MSIIPVWQESPGGVAATNLGLSGSYYDSAFWAGQGIFSTENRPVQVDFRGDIYLVGCYSRPVFRLLEDKQWYPAGIVPPFYPVQVALNPAGTGISGAALAYITFVQKLGDRVVQESNPSNVVDLGNMAGDERVWSNIQNAGAEYHVTHVRGYVSMDGADYRMAWEAPYGITTITESVSTTALSINGPDFDHNIPPSGLLYGHAWAGRMIYAHNAQYPYRLWISKAGYPGYVPTDQFRDTFGREPITGIFKGRNELVVFCYRRSYMLRQFGTGDNDFVLEELDSDVGCITHHGIWEIHNRLWFPGEDGIWLYDGSFRYLMADLRSFWRDDYLANKSAFDGGFAVQDRVNKVYIFFTKRPDRDAFENTGLSPGTIRYVGYYGNFEPSMAGQYTEPDWTLDMLTRFDSGAFYNADGELLIASCDGIVRKQDSTNGDDDGDTLGKRLILRHRHELYLEPGDDIQSGKRLDQLWCHLQAESNAWQLRCLGGDEDAWRQAVPDNTTYFWKYDSTASALTQGLTRGGTTTIYTYCAKSIHFFLPEKVVGRGFTFEIRGTTPVGMKYRGLGGMWSPGPAERPPISAEACTYPTLVIDDSVQAKLLIGGTFTLTASDLDDGSIGVAYWRLDLLDGDGNVTQTDEGTNPATVSLTLDCAHVGANTVRIKAWDKDISANPDWEDCAATDTTTINLSDPLGVCP